MFYVIMQCDNTHYTSCSFIWIYKISQIEILKYQFFNLLNLLLFDQSGDDHDDRDYHENRDYHECYAQIRKSIQIKLVLIAQFLVQSLLLQIQIYSNQQYCMIEDSIDFTNSGRKILINPIVPLQIMDIWCRNQNHRVQATMLGKIYSSSIQILEIVPTDIVEENKYKILDFAEHQKSIQNIMTVYPSLQIIGVAITNLQADKKLAQLHTIYSNKEIGFKPQGILTSPIILSVNTKVDQNSKNIEIHGYCYNKIYAICKGLMQVAAFEELDCKISFGYADFQSMTPLFNALYDNQQLIPDSQSKQMVQILVQNLKQLKIKCNNETNIDIQVKVRSIIDKLNTSHEFNMDQVIYLLDYAGLQRRLSIKLNKFQKE